MSLVVIKDIPDKLVEHGEERVEGTQASEVHDVVQVLSILEGPHYKTIGVKVLREQVCYITLDLIWWREREREREQDLMKVNVYIHVHAI